MIVEWVNYFVPLSLNFAQNQFLYSGALFLAFLPVILVLGKRYPLLVMGLCWLVILRVVLPPDLGSPVSARALWDVLFSNDDFSKASTEIFPVNSALVEPENSVNLQRNAPSWLALILFYAWVCISGVLLFRYFLQRKSLWKVLTIAKPIRHFELNRACAVWRVRLRIWRNIRLVSSDQCSFIYTMGSFRPIIFIPRYMINESNIQHLEIAIAHEIAHIKRFDDVAMVIQSIIQRLFFFNPILWACNHFMRQSRELCCDQEVLQKGIFKAYTYCENLIALVSQHSECAEVPAFGQNQKAILEKRFSFINGDNSMKKTNKQLTLMAISILGAVALPMAPFSTLALERGAASASTALERSCKSTYAIPVKQGWISSGYGARAWPVGAEKGKQKFHRGIDIAGKSGTPVYAVSAGMVLEAVEDYRNSDKPKYGKHLILAHDDGRRSHYMHLESIGVQEGQTVREGAVIATMGNTGQTTGPHLHLEIYLDGEHIDPLELIGFQSEDGC